MKTPTKPYIQTRIKKVALTRSIWFFVMVAVGLVFAWAAAPNHDLNIFTSNLPNVSSIDNLHQDKWANLEFFANQLYDTGYQHTTDDRTDGYYLLVDFPEGYIIVQVHNIEDFVGRTGVITITGRATAFADYDKTLIDSVVRDWVSSDETNTIDMATERDRFSRYKFVETSPLGDKLVAMVFMAIFAFGLFGLIYNIIIMSNYKVSRIYKSLAGLGGTADAVESKINNDYTAGKFIQFSKTCILTKDYVVSITTYKHSARATKDLVWVYPRVTQHYTNGVPSGKSFSINLAFIDKKVVSTQVKKLKNAEEVVEFVHKKYPEINTGYSEEKAELYKTDPQSLRQGRK